MANAIQKAFSLALSKKRFLKFFGVGAASAVIDLSIFFILNQFFGISWWLAFSFTFVSVGAFNYWLNKVFTFENTSAKIKTQFTVFLAIALIGYFLNIAVMFVLIDFLRLSVILLSFEFWPTIARFIAMWAVLPVNYKLHKKVTFGKIN